MKILIFILFLMTVSTSYACDTIGKEQLVLNNMKNIVSLYDGKGKEASDLYERVKSINKDFQEFDSFLAVKLTNGKYVLAVFKDNCLLPGNKSTLIGTAEEAKTFFKTLKLEYLLVKLEKEL